MSNHTKITDPSELDSLDSWRVIPPAQTTQLQLEIDGAAMEKVRAWERKLMRQQSPCGCEQGAVGLLVGVFGYLLYVLIRPGWAHLGWRELWIGCVVVGFTASVGKLLGILWGRRKLRRLIRQIRAEWKPPNPPTHSYQGDPPITARPSRACCGN
ncbi:MAG TPA: hypothetical protein VE961_24050 [Pyrinomonadaceae bacterium]|nr:hypothetical protein [Pyrinomonadaceae bacterium]